jgi:serine/threonine-protein kinase
MKTDQNVTIAKRYELQGLIETHGFAELYNAFDTQLSRQVMVQILAPEGVGDPDLSRAFLRHQQIASSIHNCSLLTVYDAGTWEGRPFSVMERDKGAPPTMLHRPGYPPDAALVLTITRQVAESLRCCREAGLSDWTFSPEAVRITPDGPTCLAIIEGLGGEGSSSNSSTDASAIHALINILLAGKPNATSSDLRSALVPAFLLSLVERLDPQNGGVILTAGEVAEQIAGVEAVAIQPTEAYVPGALVPREPEGSTHVLAPVPSPHDAPTLATNIVPAPAPAPTSPSALPLASTPATDVHSTFMSAQSQEARPYTPPEGAVPPASEVQTRRPAALLLAGLALLALLTVASLTLVRGRTSQAETPIQPAAATTEPAPAAQPALLAAPDLRGKSFQEAQQVAGDAGLNVAAVEPTYDGTYPPDTVARQVPDVGGEIAAGSVVTVSLSLGPEPPSEPTAQPQVDEAAPPAEEQPAVEPQAPAPQVQPEPPGRGKKDKKGNGKKGRDD